MWLLFRLDRLDFYIPVLISRKTIKRLFKEKINEIRLENDRIYVLIEYLPIIIFNQLSRLHRGRTLTFFPAHILRSKSHQLNKMAI